MSKIKISIQNKASGVPFFHAFVLHGKNVFWLFRLLSFVNFIDTEQTTKKMHIPVKTVSHFGFIRSLHNLLFSQLSFYSN